MLSRTSVLTTIATTMESIDLEEVEAEDFFEVRVKFADGQLFEWNGIDFIDITPTKIDW